MASPFEAFRLKAHEAPPDAAEKSEAFRQDLAVRLNCPSCPPDRPANVMESYSDGDLVCGNCGLVLGDRVIDTRSECKTAYFVYGSAARARSQGAPLPTRTGMILPVLVVLRILLLTAPTTLLHKSRSVITTRVFRRTCSGLHAR